VSCGNRAIALEGVKTRERVEALAEIFEKPPVGGEHNEPLGKAELVDHDDRSVRLRAGSATVEVTALTPDLFRVGMFPEGRTPDYDSEAIKRTGNCWRRRSRREWHSNALHRSRHRPRRPEPAASKLQRRLGNAIRRRRRGARDGRRRATGGRSLLGASGESGAAVQATRGGRMKKPDRTPNRKELIAELRALLNSEEPIALGRLARFGNPIK
jgi:hypothetical protein